METHPEGAAGSVYACASVQMRMMGAIKHPEKLIVPSDQVRRCRQQFEILNSQRSCLISKR